MAYLCDRSPTQGFYASLVDGRRPAGKGLEIRPIDESEYFDFTEKGRIFKPSSGRAFGWTLNDHISVRAEDVPTKMKLRRVYKKLPCMFICSAPWVVCDQFRDLVEQLEPNVHQFFPIDILDLKDEVVGQRYVFNICKRLDALDEHNSDISWWGEGKRLDGKPINGYGYASITPLGKLFVRQAVIQGHHFWGDKWLPGAGGRFFARMRPKKRSRLPN